MAVNGSYVGFQVEMRKIQETTVLLIHPRFQMNRFFRWWALGTFWRGSCLLWVQLDQELKRLERRKNTISFIVWFWMNKAIFISRYIFISERVLEIDFYEDATDNPVTEIDDRWREIFNVLLGKSDLMLSGSKLVPMPEIRHCQEKVFEQKIISTHSCAFTVGRDEATWLCYLRYPER